MVKTDEVIKFLKTLKGPASFKEIWENVKDESFASIKKNLSEEVMMSDLYLSLIEDERIIMIGGNNWELKEKYSIKDVSAIEKERLTEETTLSLEESDDTKELLLKIIDNSK